jgi:hypothetical protein
MPILLLCTKTEFLPFNIVSHAFFIIKIARRYMVSESNRQTNSVRFICDPEYSLLTSNLQIEAYYITLRERLRSLLRCHYVHGR